MFINFIIKNYKNNCNYQKKKYSKKKKYLKKKRLLNKFINNMKQNERKNKNILVVYFLSEVNVMFL